MAPQQHPYVQATHRIERLGTGGLAIDEVGVVGVTGHRGTHMVGDLAQQQGVGIEHAVHIAHIAGAETAREQGRIAVVAVPSTEARVVGDVARALFEIAHQATPLEHFGENVRGLFTGQVHTTELSHRIVAVFEEHLLIELFGPRQTGGGVDRLVAADVEIAHELVEEQPPQTLRAAAVPGEQRALHHLGEVHQCKNGTVEVREVPTQNVGLTGGECFGDVDRHNDRL